MNEAIATAFALSGLAVAAPTQAAYAIDVEQTGGKVVATGTGSLNLAALPFLQGIDDEEDAYGP